MPKERFHLLLADRTLAGLAALSGSPSASGSLRQAYLLGAISPDALFYDLPSFHLSPVGAALHRLEGFSALELLRSVYSECRQDLTPETGMWLMGVAAHLLVDGFWHPYIEKLSHFGHCLHARRTMSKPQCHHWLESELEGFWLSRAGPADGYRGFLKAFARRSRTRDEGVRGLRMILKRMGTIDVPDAKRIGRCFSWQAFLLRQFSLPAWSRWRNLLLRCDTTRFWGTLIVPQKKETSLYAVGKRQGSGGGKASPEDLFSDELMACSVSYLSTHLPSLSGWL
jgi:hypothetical protein